MDNNKKGINDIGSKMFNYLKEKLTASEEKDLWSSGNSGEDKGIIFQFKKYREAYAEALNNNVITTIGNKNKVEENKELFKNVRNLV